MRTSNLMPVVILGVALAPTNALAGPPAGASPVVSPVPAAKLSIATKPATIALSKTSFRAAAELPRACLACGAKKRLQLKERVGEEDLHPIVYGNPVVGRRASRS